MKEKLKSNKGVTLIALIVTIMVLIILAGVSISALIGDDGILFEAESAKQEAEIAAEAEEITLAFNKAKLKKIDNGDTSKVTPEELKAELIKKGMSVESVEYTTGGSELKVIFTNGNEHTINQEGRILGIYGTDQNAIPTSQDYFEFDTDPITKTATLKKIKYNAGEIIWEDGITSSSLHAAIKEGDDYITDINIPYEITKDGVTYTVTAIADRAFMFRSPELSAISNKIILNPGITSIKIPNTVTTIGEYAFAECTELTNIVIPNSVTSIGNHAFAGCAKLNGITIPENVTTINACTFLICNSLVAVKLPSNLTKIDYQAFEGCSSLMNITIPNTVTTIEYQAFKNCNNLKNITIPKNVTTLGFNVFFECANLTDIYCKMEKAPDGWNSMWKYCCDATVHWQDMPKYSNASLVPTDTKYFTFQANTSNKTATLSGMNSSYLVYQSYYDNILGNYFAISKYYDKNIKEYITDIVIPYEVEVDSVVCTVNKIGTGAFNSSAEDSSYESPYLLKNIVIPNTITNIEEGAFQNCTALTEIRIPSSVTSVGYGILKMCSNLKNVYCELNTIPSTWHSSWNDGCDATILMGQ